MRILFQITRDARNPALSGGDLTPWRYATYLASRGHSVTYVTSTFSGAPKKETIDGIQVIRLGGILSLWLRTYLEYMRHGRNAFDVVITEGFGGSRIPRLAPLYVKEPVVTEWHQLHQQLFAAQYPRVFLPFFYIFERLTAFVHRNTLVRAGTEDWAHAFPQIGFKPANIFQVPVTLTEDWFADGAPQPVSEPRVLWLGRFLRYKLPDHVVLAMKDVIRVRPDARLVLAGRHTDRQYEARLRELVEQLGISQNTEFRFDLSEAEKRTLLRQSRVMVLPSSVEGFGVVVLEANACGVPVIASSGVPTGAVQHEKNGLRYPGGDIGALTAAILRLLNDDGLYLRLSTTSRSFARGFRWGAVGARYEQVLLQAVRGWNRPLG